MAGGHQGRSGRCEDQRLKDQYQGLWQRDRHPRGRNVPYTPAATSGAARGIFATAPPPVLKPR